MTSPSEAWSPTEVTPIISETQEHGVSNRRSVNNWGDTEFEPLDEQANTTNHKLEEAKKKREERKLMRQKELEARRATRTTGGPMKLGAKKL